MSSSSCRFVSNSNGCRRYPCSFCRREFRSAQALGGHMNVHRRDRARLHRTERLRRHAPGPPTAPPSYPVPWESLLGIPHHRHEHDDDDEDDDDDDHDGGDPHPFSRLLFPAMPAVAPSLGRPPQLLTLNHNSDFRSVENGSNTDSAGYFLPPERRIGKGFLRIGEAIAERRRAKPSTVEEEEEEEEEEEKGGRSRYGKLERSLQAVPSLLRKQGSPWKPYCRDQTGEEKNPSLAGAGAGVSVLKLDLELHL